jgi:hypothetical protein
VVFKWAFAEICINVFVVEVKFRRGIIPFSLIGMDITDPEQPLKGIFRIFMGIGKSTLTSK